MDESISGVFQVLDIWQYTPLPDVCYVHIQCVTVSGSKILYLANYSFKNAGYEFRV
jgi:hypothetical protein